MMKPRKELGLPSDLSVEDVKAFFSLPDDDDSMHMQKAKKEGVMDNPQGNTVSEVGASTVGAGGRDIDAAFDAVLASGRMLLADIERLRPTAIPSCAPTQFVDAIFSACDASNWDADGLRGDEFRGARDAYEAIHQIASDYQSAMYAAAKQHADMLAALKSLTNEVSGQYRLAEHAIRAELGNTNYQCVIDKLDDARAAIAKATGTTDSVTEQRAEGK